MTVRSVCRESLDIIITQVVMGDVCPDLRVSMNLPRHAAMALVETIGQGLNFSDYLDRLSVN